MRTIVCWLVWSRAPGFSEWDGHGFRPAWDEPMTYRDWPLVVKDVKAAVTHGRQVKISRVDVPVAVWNKYDPPSRDQVRRLRGEPT